MSETHMQMLVGLLLVNLIVVLIIGINLGRQMRDSRRQEKRVTLLEATVKSMPTHRDLLELRTGMMQMAENIAELSGQAKTMTQMLRTIQDHLLEKKR